MAVLALELTVETDLLEEQQVLLMALVLHLLLQ
jgi:hypothetical protein